MKHNSIVKKRLTRIESMALTRSKLLEAALNVFLRDGYVGATIDGIAEAAGFSRGAFYSHFVSKEEILFEILSQQVDLITPKIITRIKNSDSAEAMINVVADWAEERSQVQEIAQIVLEAMQQAKRNGSLDERYTNPFTKNWKSVGEAMRTFFPDAHLPVEPEEIVALVVALSYSPVVNEVSGYGAGRMVKLALIAFMHQARGAAK